MIKIIISCISFDSYIKPQPAFRDIADGKVVYLLIPTSNHNRLAMVIFLLLGCISFDSYIKPQL